MGPDYKKKPKELVQQTPWDILIDLFKAILKEKTLEGMKSHVNEFSLETLSDKDSRRLFTNRKWRLRQVEDGTEMGDDEKYKLARKIFTNAKYRAMQKKDEEGGKTRTDFTHDIPLTGNMLSESVRAMIQRYQTDLANIISSLSVMDEEGRKAILDEGRKIIEDLENGLLSSTDPLTWFYPPTSDDAYPVWAKSPSVLGQGILDRLEKFKAQYGLISDPKFTELEGNIEGGLNQLVMTQRAIDGLNIIVKARAFGKTVDMTFLRNYFGSNYQNLLSLSDIKKMVDLKTSQSEFDSLVGKMFDELMKKNPGMDAEQKKIYTSLVIESNYGENASLLDSLLAKMGVKDYANDSPIEKLEKFFKAASSGNGFLSTWEKIQERYGTTANALLDDQVVLSAGGVQSDLSITRDRYDLVTMLSFISAYDNEKFMSELTEPYTGKNLKAQQDSIKAEIQALSDHIADLQKLRPQDYMNSQDYLNATSQLQQLQRELSTLLYGSEMDRFLGVITGLGNAPLPTSVSATILQSHKTLQAIYDRFSYGVNLDNFFDIMGQVTQDVSIIYQQQFGFEFEGGIKSRKDAATAFLKTLENLPDPSIIDAFIKLLMDDSQYYSVGAEGNKINIKNITQIIMDMTVPYDIMNISRMQYYDAHQDTYTDLKGKYQQAVNMVKSDVPKEYVSDVGKRYGQYINQIYLPETYTDYVQSKFRGMFKKFESFDPNNVYADANVHHKNLSDVEDEQSVTLDLSGKNASDLRGSWTRRKDATDVTQTTSNQFNTQVQNVGVMGFDIYNTFANVFFDKTQTLALDQSVLEEVRDVNINGQINGISPSADFMLMFDMQKMNRDAFLNMPDQELAENLKLHTYALVRYGTGWFRVALDKIKVTDEKGKDATLQKIADETLSRVFVANRQQWCDQFTTEQAVEVTTDKKVGFLLAAEYSHFDTRLGAMFVKTASGNWGAMGTYGWDQKTDGATPKLLSVGVVSLDKQELDWQRKPVTIQDIRGQTDGTVRKISKNLPFSYAFASYQMVDKFYALAVGGSEFAGGKIQAIIGRDEDGKPSSYLGGDLLVHYNHGPDRVQGDMTFVSSDLSANAFVDLDPNNRKNSYGGAVMKIKLPDSRVFGEGAYITLTGAYLPPMGGVQTAFNKQFLDQYQDLANRMNAELTGSDFEKLKPEEQKSRTNEYANEILSLLNQSNLFGSTAFLQDVRSEFSVAIEAPEKHVNFKIGVSQFGEDRSKFLISMVDLNRTLSFTAGVNLGDGEIKNFLGTKIRDDQTAYMFTAYNIGTGGPKGETVTVSHLWDNGWVTSADLQAMQQGTKLVGGKATLFTSMLIGDNQYNFELSGSALRGIKEGHVSAQVFLPYLMMLHMRNWMFGAQYKYFQGMDLSGQQYELDAASMLGGATLNFSLFENEERFNGVYDNEFGIRVTTNIPIY